VSDIFSYKDRRVAIVGCSSGMGLACARVLLELGAEVHGADLNPSPLALASFTPIDLKDWGSIDRAVSAIGGKIDGLFNCAGLPQTFPALDVLAVNYLGIRHWTEQWLSRMEAGSAIASISSLAGMGYLTKLAQLKPALAISDREAFLSWAAERSDLTGDGYSLSKELLNTWTSLQAVELAPRGIRINATMPGPTDTPMIGAFEKIAGAGVLDVFKVPTGRRATAEEQGNVLALLNSHGASFVSGLCVPVDGGFFGGVSIGEIDMAALLANVGA
jgi:NAD(P)-dependent dehydrogenase (short-subunit alcohol dehydrogenase family)